VTADDNVKLAVERLTSLSEGDDAILEVVAFGDRAIPALRALLAKREPSGLFQARCRIVDALAAIGAYEELIDFLSTHNEASDPVERLGDDAVINAAARALASLREDRVFSLLMALAADRIRPGVVTALGAFERAEASSYLVAALAEDESRLAAETALRRLGGSARPVLLAAATRHPFDRNESESRRRQRRSALALLKEIDSRSEI
jgi:hypothetical protein